MEKNRQIKVFTPINDDHSIERVSFAIAFKSAFSPQTLMAIQSGHDDWRNGLPATATVDQTINTARGSVDFPGVQFGFLRPNGEPIWSMEVARNEIRVDCSLYTRWDKVWGAAFDYLNKALRHVPKPAVANNKLLAIELLVKDAFLASGKYSAADFFKSKEFIAPTLLNNGPLWHCHMGWFDAKPGGKTLQNLNLTGTVVNEEAQQYLISIEHKQVRPVEDGDSIETILASDLSIINQEMIELHKSNKLLLGKLLSQDLQDAISLEG